MCGRYQFDDEKNIAEVYKILQGIDKKYGGSQGACKTGEIYPTDLVPVLTVNDGAAELLLMTWGFPKWDGKGVIINAKSETAAEKPMFAQHLRQQRCVIPSTGFYEWQKKDATKVKDKFLFTSDKDPMLYMAGVYHTFSGDNGSLSHRFVIFTCGANASMQDVHERMPVMLYREELKDWLRDERFIDFAFQRDDLMLNRTLAD